MFVAGLAADSVSDLAACRSGKLDSEKRRLSDMNTERRSETVT